MRETIQRYEAYYKNDFNDTLSAMLKRDDDGDLVLYSDHIERIAKAEARNKVLEEALREAVTSLRMMPRHENCDACKKADQAVAKADAALREDR